jgi:hypothetical protein
MGRNSGTMLRMANMKPTEFGAVSPEELVYPITSGAPVMDWPYPVLARGEGVTFKLDATSISTISEADWSATAVTTYDAASLGSTLAITRGGVWQWATFQSLYFLTNGTSFVFRVPLPTAHDGKTATTTALTVGALCGHRDRLFLGGLSGSWFSGSRWAEVLDTWRESQTQEQFAHEDMALDTGWVVYGERGGGDDETPFYAMLAMLGVFGNTAYDKFKEIIHIRLIDGEIGLCPTRSVGTIRALKGIGQDAMAYGTNGVARLNAVENRFIEQPFLNVGIPGRGCVGGDSQKHVFVDNQENVYWYTNEGGLNRRG